MTGVAAPLLSRQLHTAPPPTCALPHVDVVEGVPQAVLDQAVHKLDVAEPGAGASRGLIVRHLGDGRRGGVFAAPALRRVAAGFAVILLPPFSLTWDMLSIPPATTTSVRPHKMDWAPRAMAFMPEEQTLLTVVQSVESGRPARSEACRAGAWPTFALTTLPMKTSLTSPGWTPALSRAPLMAMEPSSGAERWESPPWKAPWGVRATPTMYTSGRSVGPAAVAMRAAWGDSVRGGRAWMGCGPRSETHSLPGEEAVRWRRWEASLRPAVSSISRSDLRKWGGRSGAQLFRGLPKEGGQREGKG